MGYIVIELPIEKYETFNYVDFDRKHFKEKTQINITKAPVHIQKVGDNLVLVFEKELVRQTSGIVVSNPTEDDDS
jgi:hypothetical protein